MNIINKSAFAGFSGLLLGATLVIVATGAYTEIYSSLPFTHMHDSSHPHPVGADEVHVHADWKVIINGEHIRFTDDKFQSISGNIQHNDIHLHDYEDLVIHRHADGITFVDFLNSIGYNLTDTCLTNEIEENFCNENENEVRLIVNGERMMDIDGYIIQEADRILLYYGDITNPALRDHVASVTDEACLYSATCLERGYKTTTTCGITCEI